MSCHLVPKRLLEEIEIWIRDKKFGHLQINFAEGRIVNVNKVESVKVTLLGNAIGEVKATIIQEI
jgi:hypothetical protein